MQVHSPRSSKKLLLLIVVFILPVIISTILYFFHDHFNFKTTNHGILLKQPIDVSYLYSSMPEGKLKKWRVLYVDSGICNAACEKNNYQLHQVQKALGKEGDRIQVISVNGKNTMLAQLEQVFSRQTHSQFVVMDKIYLVDPLGNLFMYYSASTDPMNVLNDLKKVLEVSQIG
jgi:cytochrome oxidase Cu insertion factor (SCO1/SenC/PrrC family)